MSVLDKPQLAGMAIGKGFRRVKGMIYSAATSLGGISTQTPERIAKAPPDIRTADPQIAQEFYSGRFVFGGTLIEARGNNPFTIASQGDAWDRELNAFEWLRHFSASPDKLAPNYARALIGDWIELHGKSNDATAWDLEIASKRLIAWLCNSVMIIGNADHEFYHRFMRSLGIHARFVRTEVVSAPAGAPRLYASIALAYASICQEGQESAIDASRSRLASELSNQIFPDGGHASRNPAMIVETLLLLFPLKEAYESLGVEPPAEMIEAIDRMQPALRFFRMGDGNLARFNGSTHIDRDIIATLTRLDEVKGQPLSEASHSGYQRLRVGEGTLLMDAGDAPKGELSTKAHAGCLSFEFSHGEDNLIVNCGAPKFPDSSKDAVWRASAAHSTVVLNETSSCKFDSSANLGRYVGGQIYAAQLKAESAREDASDFSAISAAHHGYVRDFGIRHQRNLILDSHGQRLSGNDWFSNADKGDLRTSNKDRAAFHFHLSPEVKASMTSDGQSCLLKTRSGEDWIFSAPGFRVSLEQSIYFASVAGAIPNWQIVIRARVATTPEVKWVLQKLRSE